MPSGAVGLVADPEDAPASGVDDGEALRGLADLLGLGVEDQVAHRCARLAIGRSARTATGTRHSFPMDEVAPAGTGPTAKGCWSSVSPCNETRGWPPWSMNVSMTSRTGAPLGILQCIPEVGGHGVPRRRAP